MRLVDAQFEILVPTSACYTHARLTRVSELESRCDHSAASTFRADLRNRCPRELRRPPAWRFESPGLAPLRIPQDERDGTPRRWNRNQRFQRRYALLAREHAR